MSWVDYRLPFRPSQDNPPKEAAESLQRTIWDSWARIHMGNRLRGRAYLGIFRGGYIDSQARGGFDTKKWKPDDGALLFRFHDADGLFELAAKACAHFAEVSFATMLAEDHFSLTMKHEGWILEPQRDALTVLSDCATPFMDLRGVLYMLSPGAKPGAPPTLLTDPRLPQLEFATLTIAEKKAVTEAVESRRCACLLCEYYRPRVKKLLEKQVAKAAAEVLKAPKTTRAVKSGMTKAGGKGA